MDNPLQSVLSSLTEQFVRYLPSLVAGFVLVAIGWILGWFIKRVIVQLLVMLRLDRVLRRFTWGLGFAKADVRFAFFDFIGSAGFLIVFLILLNAALEAMQLTVLSNLLEHAVLFLPKALIALAIFGAGWMIAVWAAGSVQRALRTEGIPRAALIAKFAKSVVILFFSAMAFTELDIAREIVVIGFSVMMITLGVFVIIITSVGGKSIVSRLLNSLEE
jgi:hypothetical protein